MDRLRNDNLSSPDALLPAATSERWQPLRSGLLNLYRYDDQEFHFHQGRLLLRGNNGAGKSRVLALQLPFLLDGEIGSHRVEPDADQAKRFEWNLLMGRHEDRLGYTWIEFARRDADGGEHYLTLGCGVRAVKGRPGVIRWFFVTPRRVGRDLYLCTPQGNPLTKDALREALHGGGELFETAAEYRQEVNRGLFGLQQERYEALILLLIELRKPQLSRQFNEGDLSAKLSNALPPVSPQIIAQVADAMRGLEEDRLALQNLEWAKQTADAFLTAYRTYAAIVARRKSEDVRKAHSAYEGRQRKLRDCETDHEQAARELEQLGIQQQLRSRDLAAAQARKQTLENSPEMRSARELDTADVYALERRREAATAVTEHESALADLRAATEALQRHTDAARAATASMEYHAVLSRNAAATCGVNTQHETTLAQLDLPSLVDTARLAEAERVLRDVVADRRRSARVLRDLNEGVERARHALVSVSAERDGEAERTANIADTLSGCEDTLVAAIQALVESYRQWHGSASALLPAPPEEVVSAIRAWFEENSVGANPLRTAVAKALAEAQRAAAGERSARRQQLGLAEAELELLRDEHDRLSRGAHQPPPPPHTRDPQSRRSRDGAPLWLLCEFRDGVPADQRAAIEAALESSGLLDAWVNPDGTIAAERLDTFLHAERHKAIPDDTTLAELLAPSRDQTDAHAATVPEEIVEGLLRSIALGQGRGEVWIDLSGHWRIGPKAGCWAKPEAQHIGHAAREAARLRRLRELDGHLDDARRIVADLRRAIADIDRHEAAAIADAARAPDDGGARDAAARRDAQQRLLQQARLRLAEAESRVLSARDAFTNTAAARDAAALDLKLQEWIARLPELDDAIADYHAALAPLWPAARERCQAVRACGEAQSRLDQTRDRAQRLDSTRQDLERKAIAAEAQLDVLRQTVGSAVEEVQRRLREVEQRLALLQAEQSSANITTGVLQERLRLRQSEMTDLAAEIEQDVAHRARTVEQLLRFTRTGLLDIAAEPLVGEGRGELSITAAVDLARRIDTALATVDATDAAWERNQEQIYRHVDDLTSALRSRDYRPESTNDADVLIVTVPFHGERRQMRQFAAMLGEEIVNRRALLTADERKVLENYLSRDVAAELGLLIRRAEELVRDMNQQLHVRPTSTGMMLQFKWGTMDDAPAAFTEARRKLLGDSATWSPEERNALGEFLQEQIRRVRDSEAMGTWQEQLTLALDYRRWHAFHVERKQDGKWQRLTKQTHGTGSGGEKAVALTIPQFAAAAAFYGSADKLAPRLIMLDEVFVGIDPDMRSKCMGLLNEFDLDFVMTSEQEWGCYATMPGLAIYQLTARADLDAVWASRWVWNGRNKVEQDVAFGLSARSPGGNGKPDVDRNGDDTLFESGSAADPS